MHCELLYVMCACELTMFLSCVLKDSLKRLSLLLARYAQICQVFESNGLTCPPWRSKKAMLSRWLVSSANDVLVAP